MAATKHLLLIPIFSLLLTLVFSRFSPHSFNTLDIPSSLQQAIAIVSFSSQSAASLEQSKPVTSSSSSSLSLQLHPRDSLFQSQHKDYKSLTLSRLARDSARVDSLNLKLQLALDNVKNSDLNPVLDEENQTTVEPEELSTPVVSGTSQGSGEYFSRVGVGSPPKEFYMVVDTGSDINWLQCDPCSDCYSQSDPIFDPSESTSYARLSCYTSTCRSLDFSACRNGSCLYQVSYGDGSYTVGDFVTETVSFGGSGKADGVAIGCGHDNEGLFVGAAGLLGLGGGSLSFPSQIKATSFSYCLVNRDSRSSSTLDFNSPLGANSVTAPLTKNNKVDTFYYAGVTGMSVGGQPVSIPTSVFQIDASGNGGIIVDSGTAITRLQTSAYNSLRDAFTKYTKDFPTASGVAIFDTCYDLSSYKSVKVPTVSFDFSDGKSVSLPVSNYLIPVDSTGTFCFAFAPTKGSLSIIGNVQQQGTRVSYDLKNSVVGFQLNSC